MCHEERQMHVRQPVLLWKLQPLGRMYVRLDYLKKFDFEEAGIWINLK
jgi:hypothetical protein